MDILFKIKHFANRTLLTFLGPADLDDNNDPREALRREYSARYADSPEAAAPVAAVAAPSATAPRAIA